MLSVLFTFKCDSQNNNAAWVFFPTNQISMPACLFAYSVQKIVGKSIFEPYFMPTYNLYPVILLN